MDSPDIHDPIVVRAPAAPNEAIGNPQPLMQLRTEDIEAFGIGSVNDMIRRLKSSAAVLAGTPANANPLLLLNGRRIADDAEVGEIPAEAVERIDILAASVSIRYGLSPDQPVMNFVLRKRFSAETGSISAGKQTSIGGGGQEIDLKAFRLVGERRLNLLARVDRTEVSYGPLRSDGLADRVVSGPKIEHGVFKAIMATNIGGFAYATLGATLDLTRLTQPLGGPMDSDANQRSNQRRIRLDATLAKGIGRWRLTAMAAVDQLSTQTRQSAHHGGATRYDATGSTLNFSALGTGPLFRMAGENATASISLAAERRRMASRSLPFFSQPMVQDSRNWLVRIGLMLPLNRGATGKGSATQSLAFAAEGDGVTGTGWTVESNTDWTPFMGLQSTLVILLQQDHASASQRAAPPKAESPVAVFDYQRNEIVDITIFSGGNSLLKNGYTRNITARLSWQPISTAPISMTAQLSERYQSNGVLSVSSPTPLLEFAFPERFQRDGEGRLLSFDARPVNLKRSKVRNLDISLSASGNMGGSNPIGAAFYTSSINVRRPLYSRIALTSETPLPGSGSDLTSGADGSTSIEWSGSLAKGGTGADLNVRWTEGGRSEDLLNRMVYWRSSGIIMSAQFYIELDTIFPQWNFAKRTKISLAGNSLPIKEPRLTYASNHYSREAQPLSFSNTGTILVRLEKRI